MNKYDIDSVVDFNNGTLEVRYYDNLLDEKTNQEELILFSVFITDGDDILELHQNIQDAYTASQETAE
jgi:hypothetical protein